MPSPSSSLKCSQCSFIGKSEQSLKVHIGRAHGAKKTRRWRKKGGLAAKGKTCATCGKSFKTLPALKAHNTRFHSGRAAKMKGRGPGRISAIERDLRQLPLAVVADCFEACRKELERRILSPRG